MTARTLTIPLAEAARHLSIDASTAYRMHRDGRFPIPVLTVGRRLVVSQAQLTAFIEGKEVA